MTWTLKAVWLAFDHKANRWEIWADQRLGFVVLLNGHLETTTATIDSAKAHAEKVARNL